MKDIEKFMEALTWEGKNRNYDTFKAEATKMLNERIALTRRLREQRDVLIASMKLAPIPGKNIMYFLKRYSDWYNMKEKLIALTRERP